MGLLDFFFSEESQIQRHTRRLTNRDSQPEDREASARWLSDKGTPQTLTSLMQRFDMALEHGMKDAGEKDVVFSLVAAHGAKAVEPVKSWLRVCKQIVMPLRLLGEIGGEEAAIQMAFELLSIEKKKDDFKPEKKKAVLLWLAERRHAGIVDAAAPFLADFDEGVRYAAVEAVAAQAGDAGRLPLQGTLTATRDESNRLKVRVCDIFVSRSWAAEAAVAERLPNGFRYADGRIVRG